MKLGRFDICLECSIVSYHLDFLREGHLLHVCHIFAYLNKHHNAEMVYDSSDPEIDEDDFERKEWTSSEFGNLQEE